jgi:hypothetical protein
MLANRLSHLIDASVEFAFTFLILMLFVCGLALLDSEQPALGALIVIGVMTFIGGMTQREAD